MGFASDYLEKRTIFPQQVNEAPDHRTGIIAVIPAYNETGITKVLDSLAHCEAPVCTTEVIIVINAPADAGSEVLKNNLKAFNDIESWKKQHADCFFRLFAFTTDGHFISGWGVGLARKAGMDEAVRRFESINNPNGVILCLDADCTVENNYFKCVYEELYLKKSMLACSIRFEHKIAHANEEDLNIDHIVLYELHLRYYFQGLAYSGFPYVFHTVGSAMAVKALPYVKAGGMNRRQGGEDFYFIQKLVPSGGYFNLNSTTVYPSSRVSDRVPFGTGATMGKLNSADEPAYFTYNVLAFCDLKALFVMCDKFYEGMAGNFYSSIPESLQKFIEREEFIQKISEIKSNTSSPDSFRKRFFEWFNMFKIVKYLNFAHTEFFTRKPVEISASELLVMMGLDFKSEVPLELLLFYRKLELLG